MERIERLEKIIETQDAQIIGLNAKIDAIMLTLADVCNEKIPPRLLFQKYDEHFGAAFDYRYKDTPETSRSEFLTSLHESVCQKELL